MLEDPAQAPPTDLFMLTTSPELAPDAPEEVSIGFSEGTPVAVNGKFLDPVAILTDAQRDRRASTASAASISSRTAWSA